MHKTITTILFVASFAIALACDPPPGPVDSCQTPGTPCELKDELAYCGAGVKCFANSETGLGFCKVWCSSDTPCPNGTCNIDHACVDEQDQFAPPAGCP